MLWTIIVPLIFSGVLFYGARRAIKKKNPHGTAGYATLDVLWHYGIAVSGSLLMFFFWHLLYAHSLTIS